MTTLRKLFVVFGAALLALGVSGSASANPLNWAGTSTLLLGDFPPVGIPGGGVATVNGSGGLGHLDSLRLAASRGQINGTFAQFVTDPDTAGNSILKIEYDGITGGTGTFAPISGVVGSTFAFLTQNVMPVKGTVRLCLLTTDCNDFLEIILTQQTANGTIGVGVGGLLTVGGDTPIKISIQGAPWTIKTATVVDHITTTNKVNQLFITKKLKGFAHGPASGTTTTAQPSGVVQLVSPAQVQTNLPLGSNKKVSSGQILRIHFIPEPGLLLLLGSGVAGLAILGRRRLRK
jgi:hypothetical protein